MIVKTLEECFKDRKFKTDDLSAIYEETYIEIPPFTKNDKGEWLNDSTVSKWVKGDKFNVVEYIQSHRDSVDLSKIIDMVSKTGDTSFLNRRQGFYGDISDIPTNLNDFNSKLDYYYDVLKGLDKDIAIEILNGDKTNDEILEMYNKKYNENIADNNEIVKENLKENGE